MTRNQIRTTIVGVLLTALAAGSVATSLTPPAAASSIDSRCRYGRVVCIDKTTHLLRWMVAGRTRLFMTARFGSSHRRTREGTFTIYWKVAHHVSNLTGENMPFSMFFSRGEAIHYSSDFAEHGYDGTSSGCVDTRDYETTRELYRATREGDRVVIYRS